ncbi:MAG: asparaginase domain-containing protein [Lachnospiraceae bacterium]|nr:asparaginase domain-containing protein [Lachnospiraceae bacterium]
MKILVIFTGGTIGSSVNGNYISPDKSAKYKLIESYKEKYGEDIDFVTKEPYTILSENLGGVYLTKLIESVREALLEKSKYKVITESAGVFSDNTNDELGGIIVTHGTDTLQYSAATLSIALGKTDIPVILVSANYPLDDERSNGTNNFIAAVEYISKVRRGGVYVSYQNTGGFANVFDAGTLLRHDIYSDELKSLRSVSKGNCTNSVSAENRVDNVRATISLSETSPVKMIIVYPGMSFEIPGEDIKKILFVPYHSGTLPTDSPKLLEFCEKMRERNVEMYICGVPEGPQYETAKLYGELGIHVLGRGTDIYWYMKLWIDTDMSITD